MLYQKHSVFHLFNGTITHTRTHEHTHTYDNLGLIHIESLINTVYTLGEFFKILGVDFNSKTITDTVNGKHISDYKNIILKDKGNIALDVKS